MDKIINFTDELKKAFNDLLEQHRIILESSGKNPDDYIRKDWRKYERDNIGMGKNNK